MDHGRQKEEPTGHVGSCSRSRVILQVVASPPPGCNFFCTGSSKLPATPQLSLDRSNIFYPRFQLLSVPVPASGLACSSISRRGRRIAKLSIQQLRQTRFQLAVDTVEATVMAGSSSILESCGRRIQHGWLPRWRSYNWAVAELQPCAKKLQSHTTTAGTNGDLLIFATHGGGYRRWICHRRGCERRRRSCERERVQLQTRARGSGRRCLAFAQGRRERPILMDLTRERNCSETRNNVSRGSDG